MCLGLITIYSAACFLDIWGIHGSGALSKMTFSGDHSTSKPVTVKTGMVELDCSKKRLMASGAIILAAWLQHK